MTNDRPDRHQRSRFAKLDRLIPLVGLGLLAYFLSKTVAQRRDSQRQLAGLAGAVAEIRNRNVAGHDALTAAPRKLRERFKRTKQFLVLAMLLALISFFAGGGTFASFSAETGNSGNSVATGTLSLSDTPNTSTNNTCFSQNATSLDNYNETCDSILALTNQAPGVTDTTGTYPGGWGKVTIANTGTLNAGTFTLWAPYVNARLNSSISSGATMGTGQTITSLTVTAIEGPLATNDQIYLSAGLQSQEFCVASPVAPGATSIPISGGYSVGSSGSCPNAVTTAGTSYGIGGRVYDQSSDTVGAPTTTLSGNGGSITSGATSLKVASSASFPTLTGTAPSFVIQIDSEQMLVTNIAGVTWTVTRGYNGTSAAAHNDTATVQAVPNTDCFDRQTAAASGASPAFNFDPTTFTPLCTNALLWVQEKTTYGSNVYTYCWFGRGSTSGVGGEDSSGECRTPTTLTLGASPTTVSGSDTNSATTLNGAITAGATSITVTSGSGFTNGDTVAIDGEEMTITSGGGTTSWVVVRGANSTTAAVHSSGVAVSVVNDNFHAGTLPGNMKAADTITFSETGLTTQTCKSSGNYSVGTVTTSSFVGVYNCSGSITSFDTNATVKDTSAFSDLNGTNSASTLSNFDTTYSQRTAGITMPVLTANGTTSGNTTVELGKSGSTGATPDTRTFYVGIYVPNNSQNQNALQGLYSTFGILFHIDQ